MGNTPPGGSTPSGDGDAGWGGAPPPPPPSSSPEKRRGPQRRRSSGRSAARHALEEQGFGDATSPRALDRLLADAGIADGGDLEGDVAGGGGGSGRSSSVAAEEVPRSAVLAELDELQDSIHTLQARVGKISRAQADRVARNNATEYRTGEIAGLLRLPDVGRNALRGGAQARIALRREKKQLATELRSHQHAAAALEEQLQRSVEALAAKQLRLKRIHRQLDYDFRTARAMIQCMFAPAPVPAGPFLERAVLVALTWAPAVAALHRVAEEVRHSAEAAGRQLMAFIKVVYSIGGTTMTADDLLPVFIFVLVSTDPARLVGPLRLFSTLQSTMRSRNHELDYYCTSLILALVYIVQQQRDDMRDAKLFKRLRDAMNAQSSSTASGTANGNHKNSDSGGHEHSASGRQANAPPSSTPAAAAAAVVTGMTSATSRSHDHPGPAPKQKQQQQQQPLAKLRLSRRASFTGKSLRLRSGEKQQQQLQQFRTGGSERSSSDDPSAVVVVEARPRRRLTVAASASPAMRGPPSPASDAGQSPDGGGSASASRTRAHTTADDFGGSSSGAGASSESTPWLNLHDMKRILRHRSRTSMRVAGGSLAELIGSSNRGGGGGGGGGGRGNANADAGSRGGSSSEGGGRVASPPVRGGGNAVGVDASGRHSATGGAGSSDNDSDSESIQESPLRRAGEHAASVSAETGGGAPAGPRQQLQQQQRRPLGRSVSMLATNFLRRRQSLGLLRRRASVGIGLKRGDRAGPGPAPSPTVAAAAAAAAAAAVRGKATLSASAANTGGGGGFDGWHSNDEDYEEDDYFHDGGGDDDNDAQQSHDSSESTSVGHLSGSYVDDYPLHGGAAVVTDDEDDSGCGINSNDDDLIDEDEDVTLVGDVDDLYPVVGVRAGRGSAALVRPPDHARV